MIEPKQLSDDEIGKVERLLHANLIMTLDIKKLVGCFLGHIEHQRQREPTDENITGMLERWDQTEPKLQREIFGSMLWKLQAEVERLREACDLFEKNSEGAMKLQESLRAVLLGYVRDSDDGWPDDTNVADACELAGLPYTEHNAETTDTSLTKGE